MSDIRLETDGLSKKYCKSLKHSMMYGIKDIARNAIGYSANTAILRKNEFWAVKDISINLKRGECLGLIGPNGSGKSTLLKILNGIISPDKGKAVIKGKVGALIELGAGFHPMLTGRENIYINGSILGFGKYEISKMLDEIVHFAELEDFIDTPVKHYSSGMYVRLGFAIAAQMNPDVLLIDEVLAVGDIGFRAKCYSVISRMLQKSAIIFVSHSMPEIARLCSKILLLDKGECVYHGNQVSQGIEHYYRLHKKPKESIISSNHGRFEKIKILNNGKSAVPRIPFLGNLKINIRAQLQPAIQNPIFHIAILNQGLQNIYHCSSNYTDDIIINDGGTVELEVEIEKLTLNPGIYYLDFAITDPRNIEIIARTHLSHQIQITGNISGYGTMLGLGKWKNRNLNFNTRNYE